MNSVLKILERMHPEVDIENCTTLIDDKILDSLDIITLVSEVAHEFEVSIPVEELTPENFNSYKLIDELIERLDD